MSDPDPERLQRACAFIAGQLYWADLEALAAIEAELRRLLRVLEAYRATLDGTARDGPGAGHLASTPGGVVRPSGASGRLRSDRGIAARRRGKP